MTVKPVRFSNLKAMAKSPQHYLHSLTADHQDHQAMRRGRLVHAQLLGGADFVVYDGERRGNAWKEFVARHPGRDIVTSKEWDKWLPIAEAVRCDPIAAPLVQGEFERHVSWHLGNRACSSRPDIIGPGYVADLKTTADSSPQVFLRQAYRMHYHAQLAFYRDALRYTGRDCADAYLIAVETSAPYPVTVHKLSQALLDAGQRLYRGWFAQLLVCEASNQWPGYAQNVLDFDLPGWVEVDEIEEEEEGDES